MASQRNASGSQSPLPVPSAECGCEKNPEAEYAPSTGDSSNDDHDEVPITLDPHDLEDPASSPKDTTSNSRSQPYRRRRSQAHSTSARLRTQNEREIEQICLSHQNQLNTLFSERNYHHISHAREVQRLEQQMSDMQVFYEAKFKELGARMARMRMQYEQQLDDMDDEIRGLGEETEELRGEYEELWEELRECGRCREREERRAREERRVREEREEGQS